MRPPFTYYGGKIGMAQRIVDLMPPHRVYIEPFGGSLAVLFAKPPCVHEIVNDLDGAIVNFWRVLREQPEQLERACALTPYSRAEWNACGEGLDDEALDQVERARHFWVRVNQSFAKRLNRTGWSATTVRTQSPPVSVLGRLGRFEAAAQRLKGVTIECCDGVDLIDRLATTDTVVYATSCEPCNSGKASVSPAKAIERASAIRGEEIRDMEALLTRFDQCWQDYERDLVSGYECPRPWPGWDSSVTTFLQSGLTFDKLMLYVNVAFTSRASAKNVWRYFCGCCWREITRRQELARTLIEDGKV